MCLGKIYNKGYKTKQEGQKFHSLDKASKLFNHLAKEETLKVIIAK